MTLEKEIDKARKDVVTDGYDMSIGEVVSLYKDGELIINPEYQRYFRWDIGRKTKFIESILLGIPIPPIFVFQQKGGTWELVDGLQRLSTLLEFMGILKGSDGTESPASTLEGTSLLPSLSNCMWDGDSKQPGLTQKQKIDIKRARLRVEILKRESDPTSKYELFQRLNTGGAALSEQEMRNCTMVMINTPFFHWLKDLAEDSAFQNTIAITDVAREKQMDIEIAFRLLAVRRHPYTKGLDVHEYLDNAAIALATDSDYPREQEAICFRTTFSLINNALGGSAFRKWNGKAFVGQFLLSVYEVIATGVSFGIGKLERLSEPEQAKLIQARSKQLWANSTFNKYSGAGVRGSDRIAHLVPFAKRYMQK